jgi:CRISPR type IV-associated protein Csf3
MKPLRVTAHMTDGRVASIDGRLHLDSMLGYAWMAENHPDALRTDLAATDRFIEPDLSGILERRGEGDSWYWACSRGVYEQLGENIEYFHKRINPKKAGKYVDFGGRRGRIVIAGGPYKS